MSRVSTDERREGEDERREGEDEHWEGEAPAEPCAATSSTAVPPWPVENLTLTGRRYARPKCNFFRY